MITPAHRHTYRRIGVFGDNAVGDAALRLAGARCRSAMRHLRIARRVPGRAARPGFLDSLGTRDRLPRPATADQPRARDSRWPQYPGPAIVRGPRQPRTSRAHAIMPTPTETAVVTCRSDRGEVNPAPAPAPHGRTAQDPAAIDSGGMDYDSAASVLTEHLRLIDEAGKTAWLSRERKTAMQILNGNSPAADSALRLVGFGPIGGTTLSWHRNAQWTIKRALDRLAAWKEMADTATQLGRPVLPLNLLHPRVASAARPLWVKGHYRHAVADAATQVSNLAQRRLSRYDVTDKELMIQAFTDKEPESGKPRLRCPGKRNSQTVRSLQQGALQFSVGVFLAIRNPAHHTIGNGDPVLAFEQLAALSTVARWIEGWDVDKYSPPQPSAAEIGAILRQMDGSGTA